MKKLVYLLLFIAFTFFSIQSWRSSIRDYEIVNKGSIEYPIIRENPRFSSGSASMIVSLNENRYRLEIGSNFCFSNSCNVGEHVKVFYSKAYDRMVLPGRNMSAGFILSAVLSLIPLYWLYKLLKN